MITGYKTSEKIKDKDFKLFVQWLYLMKSSNNATFSTYETFIRNNSDFPRIGRLQYLAEQKIYLKNSSPKNIIRWFEEFPPVSGTGKLKLGEAFLIKGEKSKSELVQIKLKDKQILNKEKNALKPNYTPAQPDCS